MRSNGGELNSSGHVDEPGHGKQAFFFSEDVVKQAEMNKSKTIYAVDTEMYDPVSFCTASHFDLSYGSR